MGRNHPVIRGPVVQPAGLDVPVDTKDISRARLVSDLKADCHANT
jgi:hypothetical protein